MNFYTFYTGQLLKFKQNLCTWTIYIVLNVVLSNFCTVWRWTFGDRKSCLCYICFVRVPGKSSSYHWSMWHLFILIHLLCFVLFVYWLWPLSPYVVSTCKSVYFLSNTNLNKDNYGCRSGHRNHLSNCK